MVDQQSSIRELAAVFLRLGISSFGGPAAHIANMHDECVKRRHWLTSDEFLDLLGATNLIPGPNSTEMAIHIGMSRAGAVGLIVAGVCFIAPAALVVAMIAILYIRFGRLPQFEVMLYAIKPVVIAVILRAVLDLSRTALKSTFLIVLAVACVILNLFGVGELPILFGAAAVGLIWKRTPPTALAVLPPELFLYFLKIGSVLFGSGYVLIAFLRADLVEKMGVLTERLLIDAIAVGQITPGPLFTTATFIGYVLAGPMGAVAATIGIFLPAFIFVALTHRFVWRMRDNATAKAALDGINVAAVALMLVVTVRLAQSAIVDVLTGVMTVIASLIIWRFKYGSAWLVLGAAVIGLAVQSIMR